MPIPESHRKQPKILIAEDDLAIVKGLEINFKNEGYEVIKTMTGHGCVNLAAQHNPDLIILDLMLTDGSGLDVCRDLRRRGIESVIIFLTVKGQELDKVVGLEVGADDYVTKPFSLRELMARTRAHLRRAPAHSSDKLPRYKFGDIEVDFERFTCKKKNKEIEMAPKEFELLHMLVNNREEVLTRDRILEAVWGYETSTTTRTVDNHVLRLRQKLEPDPARPKYILSIYGEGYKFVD